MITPNSLRGRYVEGAVMLMVETEVRRHYTAASAADLKARTEEAVHKCQTQVDGALDCMLNSHGGTHQPRPVADEFLL